jgi:hypothetical protein
MLTKLIYFMLQCIKGWCVELSYFVDICIYSEKLCRTKYNTADFLLVGRDSWVGIATCCMLDGPGIISRWGRDFLHSSWPVLGPTHPPVQWSLCLFSGVKRPGRGVNHPPTSNAEVRERVELYLYSASGHSSPFLGRILRFNFLLNLEHERIKHECFSAVIDHIPFNDSVGKSG